MWCCRVERVVGHPRRHHHVGTGVPWVSLQRTTSVSFDAQAGWLREQSANPVRDVGASTVVLSSFANVFVPHCETVMLMFCDTLEYFTTCEFCWHNAGADQIEQK